MIKTAAAAKGLYKVKVQAKGEDGLVIKNAEYVWTFNFKAGRNANKGAQTL